MSITTASIILIALLVSALVLAIYYGNHYREKSIHHAANETHYQRLCLEYDQHIIPNFQNQLHDMTVYRDEAVKELARYKKAVTRDAPVTKRVKKNTKPKGVVDLFLDV